MYNLEVKFNICIKTSHYRYPVKYRVRMVMVVMVMIGMVMVMLVMMVMVSLSVADFTWQDCARQCASKFQFRPPCTESQNSLFWIVTFHK